jgi:hypothetical protein
MTTDLTPEHTARRQGDDKELHPEIQAAYRYVESVLDSADVPPNKLGGPLWFGWALREAFLAGCSHSARAALSQPEPAGPTDEEWEALKERVWNHYRTVGYQGELFIYDSDFDTALDDARREFTRYGRPAITPIPISERLPGAEDCDAEGRCWMHGKVEGDWRLISAANPGVPHLRYCFSHWLPAHALPLPGQPAPDA